MLTVGEAHKPGLELLLRTATGQAILNDPLLGSVKGVYDPGLGAYGEAVAGLELRLGPADGVPAPNLACVIAHELTHCHDLQHLKKAKGQLEQVELALTEINAHFNQGQVARELAALADGPRAAIDAMVKSRSTFGLCHDATTRDQIVDYLLGTQQYAGAVRTMYYNPGLWAMSIDSEFANAPSGRAFHCAKNWDENVDSRR